MARGGKRLGAGRPKGSPDIAATVRPLVARILQQKSRFDPQKKQTRLERIIERAADQAEGGDWRAREWLCGRPVQPIEASGPGGGPVVVKFHWDIAAGVAARAPKDK